MAGECGFDRNLCRFLIACFTDEDHVGILAEECTQNSGKIQTDIFMRLHLAQPGEVVFDRVFSRRDVDFR